MHKTKKKAVAGISAVAALTLVGGVAAQFTASTTSAPQTIGTGTMALALDDVNPVVWTDPIANLAAGDRTERFVDLRNAGTLDIAALTMSQTNTLGNLLVEPSDVTVTFESCSIPWTLSTGACLGDRVTVLEETSLRDTSELALNTPGLRPGQTILLKQTLHLDAAADNSVQRLGGEVTYTFSADQRAPKDSSWGDVGNAAPVGSGPSGFVDDFSSEQMNRSWISAQGWSRQDSVAQGEQDALTFVRAASGDATITTTTSGANSDATVLRFSPAQMSSLQVRTEQTSRTEQTGTKLDSYSCEDGGTLGGTYCDTSYTKPARSYTSTGYTTSYYCSSGTISYATSPPRCAVTTYSFSSWTLQSSGSGSTGSPNTTAYSGYNAQCGGNTIMMVYGAKRPDNDINYTRYTRTCQAGTSYTSASTTSSPYSYTSYTCDGVGSLSGTTCYVTSGYNAKANYVPVYSTFYTASVIAEEVVEGAARELAREVIYDGQTNKPIGTLRTVLSGDSIKVYVDSASTPALNFTSTLNETSPFMGMRKIEGASGLDKFLLA